jgi:hypothetical protein
MLGQRERGERWPKMTACTSGPGSVTRLAGPYSSADPAPGRLPCSHAILTFAFQFDGKPLSAQSRVSSVVEQRFCKALHPSSLVLGSVSAA